MISLINLLNSHTFSVFLSLVFQSIVTSENSPGAFLVIKDLFLYFNADPGLKHLMSRPLYYNIYRTKEHFSSLQV